MVYVSWFLGSLLVGFLGRNRVGGFWTFFLGSALLTPLVVLLILFLSKPKPVNA